MKKPLSPPDVSRVLTRLSANEIIHAMQAQEGPLVRGRYLHWDDVRQRAPPEGLDHETWWAVVRMARQGQLQSLPLIDAQGAPIRFCMPEPVLRHLSPIDKGAAGEILFPGQVVNRSDRDRYIVNSLIEEAITSSQLEGACTTRVVAEEMLREGRAPAGRDELMIFNNFRAMEWVREHKQQHLTRELLLDLHRIVTEGTLENPEDAGRLRDRDDVRVVDHRDQSVLHQPPPAHELPVRVERLCAFANGSEEDEPFVPPVIRAILLHFMIGYDHPFADGNGRTARALFYWSMARQGYWLMEYLSISHVIKRAPSRYARAFLHGETDRNDATYFILHQLRVVREAIESPHAYLARKSREQKDTERLLRRSRAFRGILNHRQLALLSHALKHPGYDYLIEGHQRSHEVSYATARADLLKLAEAGLLEKSKSGRAWVFLVPEDLVQRMEEAA
ncbi:MAG: Fic family protein [Guyparkeria sp.]